MKTILNTTAKFNGRDIIVYYFQNETIEPFATREKDLAKEIMYIAINGDEFGAERIEEDFIDTEICFFNGWFFSHKDGIYSVEYHQNESLETENLNDMLDEIYLQTEGKSIFSDYYEMQLPYFINMNEGKVIELNKFEGKDDEGNNIYKLHVIVNGCITEDFIYYLESQIDADIEQLDNDFSVLIN